MIRNSPVSGLLKKVVFYVLFTIVCLDTARLAEVNIEHFGNDLKREENCMLNNSYVVEVLLDFADGITGKSTNTYY